MQKRLSRVYLYCPLFFVFTLVNQSTFAQKMDNCRDDDSLRMNLRIGTFNITWEKKLSSHYSLAAQFQLNPRIGRYNTGIPDYHLSFLPQINIATRYYFFRQKQNLCGPYALVLLNYGKNWYKMNGLYSTYTVTRVAHFGAGYHTGFWKYMFFDGNLSCGLSSSNKPGKELLFYYGAEIHFGAYLRKRK